MAATRVLDHDEIPVRGEVVRLVECFGKVVLGPAVGRPAQQRGEFTLAAWLVDVGVEPLAVPGQHDRATLHGHVEGAALVFEGHSLSRRSAGYCRMGSGHA